MAIKRDTIDGRIEFVFQYIMKHHDDIARASSTLGIPLEDCVCGCVRSALSAYEVFASNDQPTLFDLSKSIRRGGE